MSSNPEYAFSSDARTAGLVGGVSIQITKTKTKEHFLSPVAVGSSRLGHIKKDLELDRPLYFDEWGDQGVTSPLKRVFVKEDKIYIETMTSIYKVAFL